MTGDIVMPELCRFYNIIIKMIYNDNSQHHKPHFHVYFAEYEASVSYVGNIKNIENASKFVAEAKIIAAAPAAKKAIANLGDAIAYIDGAEMKSALEAFYTAIGMSLPADEFYYEK